MVTTPIPELFALLGDPVAGNPTQEVVEAAFDQLGLDWRYVSIRVGADDLPAAIAGLRAMDFRGVHITKPHKIAAVNLVDDLTATAAAAGAVNCLIRTDRGFTGDNTDGSGLTRAVGSIRDVDDTAVTMFGSGGAARAIAASLVGEGIARMTVYNRDQGRASSVVQMVLELGVEAEARPWPTEPITCSDDIVINSTSLGMAGNDWPRLPVDWANTAEHCLAADVVIARDTQFITSARKAGRTVVTGLDMLVEQAALSVQFWTGLEADNGTIQSVAAAELGL